MKYVCTVTCTRGGRFYGVGDFYKGEGDPGKYFETYGSQEQEPAIEETTLKEIGIKNMTKAELISQAKAAYDADISGELSKEEVDEAFLDATETQARVLVDPMASITGVKKISEMNPDELSKVNRDELKKRLGLKPHDRQGRDELITLALDKGV